MTDAVATRQPSALKHHAAMRRGFAAVEASRHRDPTSDEVVACLEAILSLYEFSGVSDEDRAKWVDEALGNLLLCILITEPIMEFRNITRIMLNYAIPDFETTAPRELVGVVVARHHPAVAVWRREVLRRDGHACRFCGTRSELQAHHVKRWRDYPSQRLVVDNGLTLCAPCHREVHSGSQH